MDISLNAIYVNANAIFSSIFLYSRAATLMQLGRVAIRSGKLAEAEQLLQASLQSYLAVYGGDGRLAVKYSFAK